MFGETPSRSIDLPQGTLDLLILRTLSPEPLHGWAVSERIQQISSDVLRVQQGSLYPVLHRMERRGWIKAPLGYVREQWQSKVLSDHQRRTARTRDRTARLAEADGSR
jgi:Transcriptional regulator PadR-like family